MSPEKHSGPAAGPMTFLEWIVVGAIIAILVGMVFSVPRRSAPAIKKLVAQDDMAVLAQAVDAYEQTYGHSPLAGRLTNSDVTYGIGATNIQDFQPLDRTALVSSNADLVAALMDLNSGANSGHKLNPRHIKFLNARMVDDTNSSGVSVDDRQFRDPWGHPYIVSLDANHDGFVRDACYAFAAWYTNNNAGALTNRNGFYEFRGRVMVWSRGADGRISLSLPANNAVNQDNLLGWR